MAERRELTLAEKQKTYAKYYGVPMAPVPEGIMDLLAKGPIDPATALPVNRRNELLTPGYLPCEQGYCIMPDGTGFVASLTTMPGVTPEMLDWWFVWHGLEALRYMIWDPDDHYGIHVEPKDLDRRMNKQLSLRARNWSTTDVVTEDIGTGSMVIDIAFSSPEDFGFDPDNLEQGAATIICANAATHAEPKNGLVCFCHQARKVPSGLELRSRFWVGWNIVGKQPVMVAQDAPAELIFAVTKGLAHHCPKEYHNLAVLLPKVYAENSHISDNINDYR